ncbi:Calcium/calmodulin-dependent protein kinase type I [Coemansia sp. RSA 1933]|nr:Calcium/calmodulin-dependent protein kinase type I [Coemansia sp. RSA 1933]
MEAHREAMQQTATVPCKYRTGRTLGRGTYAVVKELVHIETGKLYAGKIISKAHMQGYQHVISNEINILKRLARKHQNIISLVDYFETPNHMYLVMDLCKGGELFDHIRCKQVFTEKDAADIVRQITEGVAFLHAHGVVHRDLKTENCLVKRRDAAGGLQADVVIADFGMARALAPDKKSGTRPLKSLCGTPGYMAPEMVRRLGHGMPVDMWAIGVIAYFVLSGSNPFARETRHAEMQASTNCEYSFAPADHWDRISPLAKDFISSLLVYAPERRMTAQQALAHPWLRRVTVQPVPSPSVLQQAPVPQAIRPAANGTTSSGAISGKIDTQANFFSSSNDAGDSDADVPSAQNAYIAAKAAANEDQEMTEVQQPQSGELSSSIERKLAGFQLAGQQQPLNGMETSGLVLRMRNPKRGHSQSKGLCVDTARSSTEESKSAFPDSSSTSTTLTSPTVRPLLHGLGATPQAIPIKNAGPSVLHNQHPFIDMHTGVTPGNVPHTCLLTPVASITTCQQSFGSEPSSPLYGANVHGI